MTITSIQPMPTHREWWVIETPAGLQVVDYRPNTRAQAIGPFCGPDTAAMKLAELRTTTARQRQYTRALAFVAGLVGVLAIARVLL